MKKILALLLTLAMLFSLAACGGGNEDKTPSSEDNPPSSSQQQEDNTPAPDEGEDEPEGTSNEDNSNASGGEAFEWIDNDLTAGIPVPDFGVMTGSIHLAEFDTYSANYMELTDEDAAGYIDTLKSAGWSGEKSGESNNFNFKSDADDGRTIEVIYTNGMLMINVKSTVDDNVTVAASEWKNATVDPDKAADFADLTSGIPEPTSTYEINSIDDKRMFGLNFRFEYEADAKAWEQLVIDSGFTLASEQNGYRTYENDTHTVRIGSLDATICTKQ